jgi:hypothetical protein
MNQVRYVGDIEHLKGKTAITYDGPDERLDTIRVQFDDMAVSRTGYLTSSDEVPEWEEHSLGFGYHEFPAADFEFMQFEESVQ